MINLKIASPSERIYEGTTSQVTIKTTSGVITVLPNHIPIINSIDNGYVEYYDNGQLVKVDVKDGIINMNKDNLMHILVRY